MVGASARYLCLHTPVETRTPPWEGHPNRMFRMRGCGRFMHLHTPLAEKYFFGFREAEYYEVGTL